MARLARKTLADMRAMEEQNARTSMRGRGSIVGAGATPSMGLSQFRGGGSDSDSSDSECNCRKCGAGMCGGATLMPARGAPSGYSATLLPSTRAVVSYRPPVRAPPTAVVPYRPPTSRPGPIVPVSSITGRPIARPSLTYDDYVRLGQRPPTTVKPPSGLTDTQKTRLGLLLASGVPIALAISMIADAAIADANAGNTGNAGNAGYYDDYVGTAPGDDTLTPEPLPDYGPIIYDPAGPAGPIGPIDGGPPPPAGPSKPLPSANLTKKEIKWYLQSGNLPDRFYAGPGRKGSGKADGRSKRAEIVRNVMREKGMKLAEASRHVKEHGLY